MPDQWSKLLTKSAITREDYAKDPQAVLDVLEFYTDHQKRELEEMDMGNDTFLTAQAATIKLTSLTSQVLQLGSTQEQASAVLVKSALLLPTAQAQDRLTILLFLVQG